MPERLSVNDAAKITGCQVAGAGFHATQGPAAFVATLAAAVAAAAFAGPAMGIGAVLVLGKLIKRIDSR